MSKADPEMKIYRAHLALQDASNDALIAHWDDKSMESHKAYCIKQLIEAAKYLGLSISEGVSEPDTSVIGEGKP